MGQEGETMSLSCTGIVAVESRFIDSGMTLKQLLSFIDGYAATRTIASRDGLLFQALEEYFPCEKDRRRDKYRYFCEKKTITAYFNLKKDDEGNPVWIQKGSKDRPTWYRVTP